MDLVLKNPGRQDLNRTAAVQLPAACKGTGLSLREAEWLQGREERPGAGEKDRYVSLMGKRMA